MRRVMNPRVKEMINTAIMILICSMCVSACTYEAFRKGGAWDSNIDGVLGQKVEYESPAYVRWIHELTLKGE